MSVSSHPAWGLSYWYDKTGPSIIPRDQERFCLSLGGLAWNFSDSLSKRNDERFRWSLTRTPLLLLQTGQELVWIKVDIRTQPFLKSVRTVIQLQPRIQPHSATGNNGLSCISVALLKPGFGAPGSMELCMIQSGASVFLFLFFFSGKSRQWGEREGGIRGYFYAPEYSHQGAFYPSIRHSGLQSHILWLSSASGSQFPMSSDSLPASIILP